MALDRRRLEEPPVVLRGDHRFPAHEHLDRLVRGRPPDHVVADAVEPLEREPQPALRAEELVEVLARHPVRPQRPLEVRLRTSLERPRSGETAEVEEVRDPGGPLPRERVAVVGGHHGVDDLRDPALGERPVDEVPAGRGAVGSGVEPRVVDGLEQALAAGGAVVGHGHVHEVPGRVARVELPAKLVQPAVVALDVDPDPRRLRERLEVGLDLASFIRPAPGRHGDRPVGVGSHRDRRRDRSREMEPRHQEKTRPRGECALHRRLSPWPFKHPHSPRAGCRSSCPGKP